MWLSLCIYDKSQKKLHLTNVMDGPPVRNIFLSARRSQRFMIKWLNSTVNSPQLLSGHTLYSLARWWWRLKTCPITTDKTALEIRLYQWFKNGWSYTFWYYFLTCLSANCMLPCYNGIGMVWSTSASFAGFSLTNRIYLYKQITSHLYNTTIYTVIWKLSKALTWSFVVQKTSRHQGKKWALIRN